MAITASIVGPTFVTVMVNGVTNTITNDHANYPAIRQALKDKNYAAVENLINVAKAITTFVAGKVRVDGDRVLYGDREVKGSVVSRILQMIREGFDAQPMINFLENLMSNPSKRAVDELYGFLEATKLPITEDGCFLAYKKVADDYKDFYTGTIPHDLATSLTAAQKAKYPVIVGNVTVSIENDVTTLSMPRNEVDEDKDRTCSYGLHFCSFSYLPHYHGGQGRVLLVKINPRDVVAVPSDYNNAKGRACGYQVIEEHKEREREEAFTSPVYRDATPVAPKPTTPKPAAPVKATGRNPALIGYNTGRSDASRNKPYDETSPEFTGTAGTSYATAYAKGYNSIVGADDPVEPDASDYDRGYEAGEQAARVDVENLRSYRDSFTTVSGNHDYVEGFEDGYSDVYDLDFQTVGYDEAYADADDGNPYDDTPPSGASVGDAIEYRRGYADGWRDSKLNQL